VASTLQEPNQAFLNKIIQAGYGYRVYKQNGKNRVFIGPFSLENAKEKLFGVKKMINYDAFIVKIIF
jgi:hypothetical protein